MKKLPEGFKEFLIKCVVFVSLFVLIQLLTMGLVAKTQLPSEIKPFAMDDLAEAFLFVLVLSVGFSRKQILKIKKYSVSLKLKIFSSACVFFGFLIYFSYKQFLIDNLVFVSGYVWSFVLIEYFILLSILFCLFLLVFGFEFFRDLVVKLKLWSLLILGGIPFVYFLISQFQRMWGLLSGVVGNSVCFLLNFIGASVLYYLEEIPVIVFHGFVVGIAGTCSGIDSILMFCFLFFGIMAWDWKTLDKRKSFCLFFIGVVFVFALNIFRIFLLIIIGVYISKDFALNVFHTNASSVLFLVFFAVFWKLSYNWIKIKNG